MPSIDITNIAGLEYRDTVVIYSGGSDSFTLLHLLLANGYNVEALSFTYGQRHGDRELFWAEHVCRTLGIAHQTIPLRRSFGTLVAGNSALTDPTKELPEGFYAQENMRQTVVPNRNMVMLALATAHAIVGKATYLSYGAHAGDHDIYPDCRPAFIEAMQHAVELCDYSPPRLIVPFMSVDKRAIYTWGLQHGLDYTQTWTCYRGIGLACGKCGSCVERLHAFHDIGAKDPLEYEDRDYWKTVIPGGVSA